ncbi:DUF2812 domain-containing protein [Clostridium bowmanii]|uniref:DUF2812 domain-containing protein n=1 Tax=Clostridium bowmanii TaxID=132925 RepID=UPI001C0DEEE9|nr:DUF2812 domain-containing protein [Clostridium bowmanii]MBU3190895.1 DUF2812 domain-containing protein [Clostridium bowmanii]MCA1075197.1 DUF2812 domain-containing protein [Clostridium bowmanii]
MLKFKLYYDKDVEEDWLKKMCLNGWAFKKFFLGFYTFEKCEPGEYNYQIELLDSWNGEKHDYSAFMEDTEVKVISQWWRWVYLQKMASDGPFEMYTDIESKITQYNKIKNFFKVALVVELICFFMEAMATINTGSYIFAIFTVLLAVICLAILQIVWKCKWKIEQYKHEKDM